MSREKPLRVKIWGQAYEWVNGGVPVELTGAAVPSWLSVRVDALYAAIYRRLHPYAIR